MSTQLLPTPADTSSGGDRKPTVHCVCPSCYPIPEPGNIALCGHRCRDGKVRAAALEDLLCVVCFDLLPQGCPKCGARP